MNLRRTWASIALGVIALAARAPLNAERARPNVVILLADDLGTLDVGCYGATDLHTPHLDKLAESGIRFTQAYAHTVCCPARAALLTGRHPQRAGVNSWTQGDMRGEPGINMYLEEVTLAEALQPAGYRSALFGKWHLGSHHDFGPLRQGFDEFFGLRDGFIDNYNHYFLHGKGFHDLYEGTAEVWARGKYFPDLMTRRAIDFIERSRDRPFFLHVAFNIPHYPEQALAAHGARYAELPQPRRTYAAAVTTTDHFVGMILERIESLGLRDDTIVLFLSDNGHSQERSSIRFDDHNSGLPRGHDYGANGGGGFTGKWRGHKGTFLEGGVRTPAILRYPRKIRAGETRGQSVTAMDWYPTILELCDVKPGPQRLDGRSLARILDNAAAPEVHETLHFQWQQRWAVRSGQWKLIGREGRKNGEPWSGQLFQLGGDRPETEDFASSRPETVAHLRALHEAWREEVFATARSRKGPAKLPRSSTRWSPPRTPPAILLDADMTGAVDDVGALATLHALADAGKARVLATITNGVDASGRSGACCDAINTYFGRGDLPVAVGRSALRQKSHFTAAVATSFPHDSKPDDELPSAVETYRRVLASQPDSSVTIVTLGFLNNLAQLHASPPDRHSPLKGVDLVRQKVDRVVVMGGDFPEGRDTYNLLLEFDAASRTLAECPVPLALVGIELGYEVLSGTSFPASARPSPVRLAYELQARGEKRTSTAYPSWDAIAVAFAVLGPGDLWTVSSGGRAKLETRDGKPANPREAWTRFDPSPNGTHFYVRRRATNPAVARKINAWVTRRSR